MADDSAKDEGAELPKDVLAPAEGPRENLVVTAVKFLQNPKVRQSPLSQKKAFLERKGLTKDEIQLAVERAGVTDDTPSSSQVSQLPQHPAYANTALAPPQPLLPSPPISGWTKAREIATTTAIVAAVSYAVYRIFKTYIQPWLIGKSETEARLERLEASIAQLQTFAAESNAQMVETLKTVQESLAQQREGSMQNADFAVRQESQTLNEIRSEVSSLKGLLLNRRQFPPPPATSPIIPTWQKVTQREDQPLQLSPPKPESAASQAGNDSDKNTVQTADPGLEEEKLQPSDNGATSASPTSEGNLQASQSISSEVSASQSTSSSSNGFEMVKHTADSDAAAELD